MPTALCYLGHPSGARAKIAGVLDLSLDCYNAQSPDNFFLRPSILGELPSNQGLQQWGDKTSGSQFQSSDLAATFVLSLFPTANLLS